MGDHEEILQKKKKGEKLLCGCQENFFKPSGFLLTELKRKDYHSEISNESKDL